MDFEIKKEIASVQVQFLKAIECHKKCYGKLQQDGESDDLNIELMRLKEMIKDCKERHCLLMHQLQNTNDNTEYKFNLYTIPKNAAPKKKRRRKDVILPVKSEYKRRTALLPERLDSRSPSPVSGNFASSSSSSDHEDTDDEGSQSSQPVPLPRARAKLLNDRSLGVSRHDVKYPKIRRRRMMKLDIPDEVLFRDIPVIKDPPPSPEPTDEREIKVKFMAALNLIPSESLPEIISKKVERKRRSTANPHFVYNDEWDAPKKKVKQYLSPAKKSPLSDGKKDIKDEKDKGSSKIEPKKLDLDSNEEDGDATDICKTCKKLSPLRKCADCNDLFHAKCPSIPIGEQSFLLCRRCRRAKRACGEDAEESLFLSFRESSKNGGDSGCDVKDKMMLCDKLLVTLHARLREKTELEARMIKVFESRLLQDKMMKDLESEEVDIKKNIDKIRNFVTLFQMIKTEKTDAADIENSKPVEETVEDYTTSTTDTKEGEIKAEIAPLVVEEPSSGDKSVAMTADDDGIVAEGEAKTAKEDPLAEAKEEVITAKEDSKVTEETEEKPVVAEEKPKATEETEEKPVVAEEKPKATEEKPVAAEDTPKATEEKPVAADVKSIVTEKEEGPQKSVLENKIESAIAPIAKPDCESNEPVNTALSLKPAEESQNDPKP